LNILFLNDILFTSSCLLLSELNDKLNFVEKILSSDFLIGKSSGRLIFRLIRYSVKSVNVGNVDAAVKVF
jgi:hypothetical protein